MVATVHRYEFGVGNVEDSIWAKVECSLPWEEGEISGEAVTHSKSPTTG